MAFAINQGFVQNANGRVQPGATVTVYLDTVGQPLATQVYADRDGATPKGNPFVADADGYYFFYSPGGAYKLVATFSGSSRTFRHVANGLAQESDIVPAAQDFETLAQAAASSIPDTVNIVRTWGRANFGDLGGATFVRSGSEPAHAGKFQSSDGAWWKIFDKGIDIRQLGAKATGSASDASVNADAVRAAFEESGVAIIPSTEMGFHFGTQDIDVESGKAVMGHGAQPLIKSTSTTQLFSAKGYDVRSCVQNLTVDMDGAGSGSTAVRLRKDLGVVWGLRVKGIRGQNCYSIIDDAVSGAAAYSTDIEFSDIYGILALGCQVRDRHSRGSFLLRDIFVNNTYGIYQDPVIAPLVTWDSISLSNFIGMELDRMDVVGQSFLGPGGNGDGTLGYYIAGARGIVIDGDAGANGDRHLWIHRRLRAEACNGHGIVVSDVTFLDALRMESFACRGYPIYLENIDEGRLLATYARGASGLTTDVMGQDPYLAGASALNIIGSDDLEMTIVGGSVAQGDGVLLHNSFNVNINHLSAELNEGAPLRETGTSDRNTIDRYNLRNNTTPGIVLAGANSKKGDGFIDDVSDNEYPWLPAISIGGSTTGITYGLQWGRIKRRGKNAQASGRITLSSKGGLSGTVVITGLPIAARNVANGIWGGVMSFANNLVTITHISGVSVAATGTTLAVYIPGGGVVQGANISDNTQFVFSVEYEI